MSMKSFCRKYVFPWFVVLFCGTAPVASLDRYESLTPTAVDSFSFLDENGYPVSLNQYKGKVVLLNIWSLGCNPCINEMPSIDRLSGLYSEDELVVIPLNIDGKQLTLEKLGRFFDLQKYRYIKPFSDPDRSSQKVLKWQGLPTTYFIDKDGYLVGQVTGATAWDSLDVQKAIDRMIKGKKPLKKKGIFDKITYFFKGIFGGSSGGDGDVDDV